MKRHALDWLVLGVLLAPLHAWAETPPQPVFGAAMEHAPEEDLSIPVQAKELRLDTPSDVFGRNFKPADLLAFGGRTDRAAEAALLKLHPAHKLNVSIRYTLSADKAHDVRISFVPDEVRPEDADAMRDTLLEIPTVRSTKDVVSFTRTYLVHGVNDLRDAANAPPRGGVAVPDLRSDENAVAALTELAEGTGFAISENH